MPGNRTIRNLFITKYYEMALCNCKNRKEVVPYEIMKNYSLQNDCYTSFMIFQCGKCEKFIPFPRENFDLALKEGTEETKLKLYEYI